MRPIESRQKPIRLRPLTEFNMLGNVATQLEGPLEYDPVAGKIVNRAEADKALRTEYREGWSL